MYDHAVFVLNLSLYSLNLSSYQSKGPVIIYDLGGIGFNQIFTGNFFVAQSLHRINISRPTRQYAKIFRRPLFEHVNPHIQLQNE